MPKMTLIEGEFVICPEKNIPPDLKLICENVVRRAISNSSISKRPVPGQPISNTIKGLVISVSRLKTGE